MLDKIEFSDLYKFLTSVGLIIIASSFIIPWLFMKQDIGLLISTKEYSDLIESSKNLTDNRIKLGIFITKAIPFISGILFILGSIISGIGLYKWKKKQESVDETDNLKLTELKAKVKELDREEILEKAELEVKNEILLDLDNGKNNSIEIETKEETLNIEKLRSQLINMERLFFDKIIEFNSFIYNTKSNVKIDEKYDIDILLKSNDNIKYPDIFIEVKYIQNKLNFSLVKDGFGQLIRAYSQYTKGNNRKVQTILIVVYKSDIAEPNEISRFAKAIYDYEHKFRVSSHKILLMSDIEAKSFDIKKIIK